MVHERLESRQSIAEPEEHNHWFKKAKRGDECAFPLVFFSDVDIVEPPSDVKLGKERGILYVVN